MWSRRDVTGAGPVVQGKQTGLRLLPSPALTPRAARNRGIPIDGALARDDAEKAFTFADLDRTVQYQYGIEAAMDDAYRLAVARTIELPLQSGRTDHGAQHGRPERPSTSPGNAIPASVVIAPLAR